MRKVLLRIALTSLAVVGLVPGCGSDGGDDGKNLPPRTVAADAGAQEGYDCSNREKVDDRPLCDQCVRAKCCEFVVKCDRAPECKALQECLAPCPADDMVCILGCQATHENGASALRAVGACASTECKAECKTADVDAGFEF